MCYDIKASLKAQLNRARQNNDEQRINEIIDRLQKEYGAPYHHVSGFNFPFLIIYQSNEFIPTIAKWGLIPAWVKDESAAQKIRNSTLNARLETANIKPSFKESLRNKRCVIEIDGFYEHRHFGNKTYPYFIQLKSKKQMTLAGIWSEWNSPLGNKLISFSILTSTGNQLMSKIHNNPKLEGPRMPYILSELEIDSWLENNSFSYLEIIQKKQEVDLQAHTVFPLRSANYRGNVEGSSEPFDYPELLFAEPIDTE